MYCNTTSWARRAGSSNSPWSECFFSPFITSTLQHTSSSSLVDSFAVNPVSVVKRGVLNRAESDFLTLGNPLVTFTFSPTQTASFSDTCCRPITEPFQFAAYRCQQLRYLISPVRRRHRLLSPPEAPGTAGPPANAPHRARCCPPGGKKKLCCLSWSQDDSTNRNVVKARLWAALHADTCSRRVDFIFLMHRIRIRKSAWNSCLIWFYLGCR